MNFIKGFMTNAEMANNAVGAVSALGELSTYSLTFSRATGNFANATFPDVELVSFSSKDDLGAHVAVPTALADTMLELGQWVYDRYNAGTIPANADKATFLSDLAAAFPSLNTFAINELVQITGPTANCPDYVEFQTTVSATDYTVRVWFMDARFRAQYDEYEIVVIPPIDDIDLFNNQTSTVSPLLAELTPAELVLKMQAVITDKPATLTKTRDYTWVDPTFSASTRSTTWTLVIYGAAGDDADNMKNAIRDYIDDNGDAGIDWPALFPDIYSENEFVICPMWNRIAAPESGFDYGIYSTTVPLEVIKSTATAVIPDAYGLSVTISTFLDLNLQVSSAFWRSVAFLAVGNPNNAAALFKFSAKFADYMNIPTDSSDWGRMSLTTQNFALKLNEALEHARTMTSSSPVPVGFNRVLRNTKRYLSFDYAGTTYLIVTKATFDDVVA